MSIPVNKSDNKVTGPKSVIAYNPAPFLYNYVFPPQYAVTLAGEGLLTFRGFMLQARQVLNDSAPAGRFAVLDDVNTQLSQCKPPEVCVSVGCVKARLHEHQVPNPDSNHNP